MGALSFLRKDKQESGPDEAEFQTRAQEETKAVRSRRKRKQGAEGEAPVDPVLPEKKRARRRLIGAVALVLAAVIGLPMVLDSEPKPLAEDIAIQIPAKDKPADARTEPTARAGASAPSRSEPVAGTLDKGEEIVNLPASPAASAATAISAPKAAVAAPAAQVAAVAPAANAEKKQPPARTESKTVPASPAPHQNDATTRARAILESRPEQAVEKTRVALEKKPARFMVQVAALASQDKVNELQGKLKGAGIRSQAQKVPTQAGERIRVRVGPFASKDEAEKMRARLHKLGLGGTVIPA